MATILVKKPFRLLQADGTQKVFNVGNVEVTDEEADHWYVQAHSEATEDKKSRKPAKGATPPAAGNSKKTSDPADSVDPVDTKTNDEKPSGSDAAALTME